MNLESGNARHALLVLALAATLAATWWATRLPDDDADTLVEAAARADRPSPTVAQAAAPTAPAVTPAAPVAGDETRFPTRGPDLFAATSFRPPPPPVIVPPPPPPQAPALPFRYLGRWQEDGIDVVFLEERERTHLARQGDRLGPWRVDTISEQAISLTFLPLEQQRTLRLAP